MNNMNDGNSETGKESSANKKEKRGKKMKMFYSFSTEKKSIFVSLNLFYFIFHIFNMHTLLGVHGETHISAQSKPRTAIKWSSYESCMICYVFIIRRIDSNSKNVNQTETERKMADWLAGWLAVFLFCFIIICHFILWCVSGPCKHKHLLSVSKWKPPKK